MTDAHPLSHTPTLLGMLGYGREQNLRYGWLPKSDENKWFPVGQHEKRQTHSAQSFNNIAALHPDKDIYLSPNEFFSWRNTRQISLLHANYIEIDTTGHAILSLEEEKAVINEVFVQLLEADIPYPSAMVRSGSGGIHLYWVYEPIKAYNYVVSAWKQVTQKIANSLSGGKLWHVDISASIDASRVLRFPGSKHSKSGRTVTEQVFDPELYRFSSLLSSFGLEKLLTKKVVNIADYPKKASGEKLKQQRQATGKHNIKTWWTTIYFHIVNQGRRNGFKVGQRDHAAFMLFVALRHIKPDIAAALKEIHTLNDELIHLTETELTTYLKTAQTTEYKYKKQTLADYLSQNLGMDTSFLFLTGNKVRLSPAQRKEKRSNAAQETAKVKRQSSLIRIKRVYTPGATQSALAKLTDLSVRTIRRYWQQIQGVYADISLLSI
jgi:hypothetical protein